VGVWRRPSPAVELKEVTRAVVNRQWAALELEEEAKR
jgi:hypothetical protein